MMVQFRPFSTIPSVITGQTVDLKLTGSTVVIDWLNASIVILLLVMLHP